MSRKIILFGPYAPPAGGVATFMKNLYENIQGKNVELWAVSDNVQKGNNVYNVKGLLDYFKLIIFNAKNSNIVDSWITYFEYPSTKKRSILSIFALNLLKKINGFVWIKVIHDGSLPKRYDNFSKTQKVIFSLAARSVDKYIVMNEGLKEWLNEKEGIIEDKITVINSLLPTIVSNKSNTNKRFIDFISKYDKIICTIGAFVDDYGIKDVVHAANAVKSRTDINLGIIIINSAFDEDSDYKREITTNHQNILVVENAQSEEVNYILTNSDIFVRGVKNESLGLSRIEAILCGTPVIATNVGETRGMTTYCFGDVIGLSNKIEEALLNPGVVQIEWQEVYKTEAYQNLSAIKKYIGLDI